jgi:hypothetical protein
MSHGFGGGAPNPGWAQEHAEEERLTAQYGRRFSATGEERTMRRKQRVRQEDIQSWRDAKTNEMMGRTLNEDGTWSDPTWYDEWLDILNPINWAVDIATMFQDVWMGITGADVEQAWAETQEPGYGMGNENVSSDYYGGSGPGGSWQVGDPWSMMSEEDLTTQSQIDEQVGVYSQAYDANTTVREGLTRSIPELQAQRIKERRSILERDNLWDRKEEEEEDLNTWYSNQLNQWG